MIVYTEGQNIFIEFLLLAKYREILHYFLQRKRKFIVGLPENH